MHQSLPQPKVTLVAEKENVDPGTPPVLNMEADEESLGSCPDQIMTSDSSDESDHRVEDTPSMASLPPSPPLNRTPISIVKLV